MTKRGAALAVLCSLLLAAPAAHAASPYGNVVEVKLPRPAANELVLGRAEVDMQRRGGRVAQTGLGSLRVRRAGGGLAAGFAVAAVQARPRGSKVVVRLAAVRTGTATSSGPLLRFRLRIGTSRVVFRRLTTAAVAFGPDTTVRSSRDCRTIVGEAARWRVVPGLAGVSLDGARFDARTAVGAAQQIACDRRIDSVPAAAAAGFLEAVDPAFGGGAAVEGFYATWVKNPNGTARICVFVRGDTGATGDVTVASTRQPFTLSDDAGVARTVTAVAGEGRYAFTVRWRQSDGTFRTSASAVRVPAQNVNGQDPPAPYSSAGTCS